MSCLTFLLSCLISGVFDDFFCGNREAVGVVIIVGSSVFTPIPFDMALRFCFLNFNLFIFNCYCFIYYSNHMVIFCIRNVYYIY